ncbi:FAD/NAD(P)-binding domain-containing protein [Aspergillus eucalypticola CBS 122712]|uniref:FAD/NAD(P)-binding domain-containing protein n=1 Tax=Aspergillus eucalypticola (strain CBS 122712 / IBT 29274) TaxID=1448314 RepID=A0A317UI13_ASPEC|nr:FAD/NAD(P)-binding domain-containing protein [Aspergillus eucalypticola CBS 122712]PWY61714.1 FAD/NAD(P)-binding domain-containing protein [Aspergillus eucalypticola CBS 122712]
MCTKADMHLKDRMKPAQKLDIAVIGAGWYGCHIALELKKEGHHVVVFEKQPDILQGISGTFGIRLHKGPHYPRSKPTREACRDVFEKFCHTYPELVVAHEQSIYGLGERDALGYASKVTPEVFHDVCNESPECRTLDVEQLGFAGLISAYDMDEPSIVIGNRLRSALKRRLHHASVDVRVGCDVKEITKADSKQQVSVDDSVHAFDVVVNATAYHSLIPAGILKSLPVDIEVTYQACIGLVYEDQTPQDIPFSFIVMDGWFPCIMPAISTNERPCRDYLIIHGAYTVMGSYDSLQEAQDLLGRLDDAVIGTKVRSHIEHELERFWPGYTARFVYKGWRGATLPKLKTRAEFRSSLTFERDGVIYIFPGKINNVFNAAEETLTLVDYISKQRMGVLPLAAQSTSAVHTCNGVCYTTQSAFSTATQELAQKPSAGEQSTSNLQSLSIMDPEFGVGVEL